MAKATIAEIRKAIFKELLKNGDMSSNRPSGDGDIRRALIEADLVDGMVTLPANSSTARRLPFASGLAGKITPSIRRTRPVCSMLKRNLAR